MNKILLFLLSLVLMTIAMGCSDEYKGPNWTEKQVVEISRTLPWQTADGHHYDVLEVKVVKGKDVYTVSNIEGFVYDDNYTYRLEVEVKHLEWPSCNGETEIITLLKEISKTPKQKE